MIDEPKLQRTNEDGWEPVTGWHALKLWAFMLLMTLLCGVAGFGVFRFVFGWL